MCFTSICLIIAIFMCAIVFVVDPFYMFRLNENPYILSERYSSPGLVKHYNCDTLLIGSSMIQNTDMDYFNEKLDTKAVKIGISGIGLEETAKYINLASKRNDIEKYYVCIDLASLNKEDIATPEFLFEDDILSYIKYFFNYEVWTRYMPIDVALIAMNKMGIELPLTVKESTDVKYIGEWKKSVVFGKKRVIRNYLNKKFAVSSVEKTNLISKSKKRIDDFFDRVDMSESEFNFFFPPYSALAWYNNQKDDIFDEYLIIKEYFIEKAHQNGSYVYDFQASDFILDLDNYKDTTHYSPEINNWMTDCFQKEINKVNNYDVPELNKKLRKLVEDFKKENPQL